MLIGSLYNMQVKVSVIVPIYKVEGFIERCVRSLMEQTLDEVEYIFVDDASPDQSIAILQRTLADYPERASLVRILTHEQNKGLPAARNTGLEVAQGEYIFHCDSDDYVEREMLAEMYATAKQQDADFLWCDWWLSFEKNERYMSQPTYDTPIDAVKAMLGGAMKYNVWNKLVLRSLYQENGIVFPAGYGMGEDMTMMMLCACAKRVAYIPKAYYHYVKLNTGAFSQTFSEQHLVALQYNVRRIADFMERKFDNALAKEVAFLKLEVKFPFLIIGDSKKLHQLWSSWFPEANAYILQHKDISWRNRIVQWCASKNQFWIVKCYYWLISKFIYGIIYR